MYYWVRKGPRMYYWVDKGTQMLYRIPSQEIRPLSEMPVWARLMFMKMIPETYFLDYEKTEPSVRRRVCEATVYGFTRKEDTVFVLFTLPWPEEINGSAEIIDDHYIYPADKSKFAISSRTSGA